MKTELTAIPAQPAPRWMVVDDNRDLLAMMSTTLAQLHGRPVECFDSPQAALNAFAAAPSEYEMVLTDYEMPGLDGIALCQRLRALAPALKVFLATGSGFFTEAAARHAGFQALLNKPFPLSALRETLAAAGLEIHLAHQS
jgi:CheY-like chemotaxis protein